MNPPDVAGGPVPDLGETIELQRIGCELAGSPLYAEVLDAVATDVAEGGVCEELLAPWSEAAFGDAVVLRFLAAVHLAVLRGDEPALAAHYPSVGGVPGRGLGPCFLDAVERHRAELVDRLTWGVQTNEVGRSAALVGGFQEAARAELPLRILELGASAGLNLQFDRYRYRSDGAALGPTDSPLVFDEPWIGAARPDLRAMAPVVERRGCDREPIDPTQPAGRLRLRSLVWPDQPARRHRLDAAILVATTHRVVVERADACDWLAERLAAATPGRMTVVFHSIVLQYLAPSLRSELFAVLDGAGRRATAEAPLVWLRMEPGGDRAETRLTVWPGGATELLATSGYHGPPVAWRARGHRAGR